MPNYDRSVENDAHEGEWKEHHTKAQRDRGEWVSGECIDCDDKFTDSNGWTTHHTDLSSFDRDYDSEP